MGSKRLPSVVAKRRQSGGPGRRKFPELPRRGDTSSTGAFLLLSPRAMQKKTMQA